MSMLQGQLDRSNGVFVHSRMGPGVNSTEKKLLLISLCGEVMKWTELVKNTLSCKGNWIVSSVCFPFAYWINSIEKLLYIFMWKLHSLVHEVIYHQYCALYLLCRDTIKSVF